MSFYCSTDLQYKTASGSTSSTTYYKLPIFGDSDSKLSVSDNTATALTDMHIYYKVTSSDNSWTYFRMYQNETVIDQYNALGSGHGGQVVKEKYVALNSGDTFRIEYRTMYADRSISWTSGLWW